MSANDTLRGEGGASARLLTAGGRYGVSVVVRALRTSYALGRITQPTIRYEDRMCVGSKTTAP